MPSDSTQRYVEHKFICVNCKQVNQTRIDTLRDLYYKWKNPPLQDGHRRSLYYQRNCLHCHAYNEVLWEENSR